MSEAQIPNATDLPDRNEPLNGMEITPEKPETDAIEPSGTAAPDQQPTLAAEQAGDRTSNSDPVAEALIWQSDADVAELVGVSEALRQQNSDLIDHVQELENLLEECHTALQSQVKRTQSAENKLVQQTSELQTTQDQLTRLFRELEASHQVAQRQQILIETLTVELQASQERVAQLERQCALIQQRYNEQSQMLLQSETACGELQDRLQRQQRYTLQFKAALDKCLEMPGLKELAANIATAAQPETNLQNSPPELQRFSVKPQPIRPWSAKSEISQDAEVEASEALPASPAIDSQAEQSSAEVVAPEAGVDNADIETFVNPFFGVEEPDILLEQDLSPAPASDSDIEAAEQALWAEIERLTQQKISSENVKAKEDTLTPEVTSSPSPQLSETFEVVAESEVSAATEEKKVLGETSPDTDIIPLVTGGQPPSWPSPLVYPERTPKKIKSLAAIDLPTFPKIKKA